MLIIFNTCTSKEIFTQLLTNSSKTHKTAEEFDEEDWCIMATGMKRSMRVGGSRNNKLLKNAKKFAEGKHPETYSELEDINNKLELGDALGEIY